MDCLSLNMKPVLINNQSGSNRWVFLSVSLKQVLRYQIKWLAMSGGIFSYIGKLSVSRYSIFTRYIEIIHRNCFNRKNISCQNVKKHVDILYSTSWRFVFGAFWPANVVCFRFRVMKAYNAKTDAELTLTEGEIVFVQRPRAEGRILVTQEISGKTGLFHSSVLEILDKLLWVPQFLLHLFFV